MNNSKRTILPAYVCAVILVSGCTGGRERPADMPALFPARLTITQDNAPLENAAVTLHSTDADFQWSVVGETDARGIAVLRTNGFFDGVPAGTYKITVSRTIRTGPPIPDLKDLPSDEAERSRVYAEIERQTRIIQVVDPLYRDAEQTPLEWEVIGRRNESSFDVGKPVEILMPVN